MKKSLSFRLLIGFFTLIALFNSCKNPTDVIIKGNIVGKFKDEMTISNPINGFCYYGFQNTIKPDSQGNFRFLIPVRNSSLVNIYAPNGDWKILLIEPGDSLNIRVNAGVKKNSINIYGPNEKALTLYNSTFSIPSLFALKRKLEKISVADSLEHVILEMKQIELGKFKNLLDKKLITKSCFKLISTDINCFYVTVLSKVLYSKFLDSHNLLNTEHTYKFSNDLMNLWTKLYNTFTLDKKDVIRSNWWYEYAEGFINFKIATADTFNIQNDQELYVNGLWHSRNLKVAKQYLNGKDLEYFEAAYMHTWLYQKQYEKEFISIYNDFKTIYPQSAYLQYINPMIDQLIDFHRHNNLSYSQGINIVENYDRLNSLSACLNVLRGKKIYLDIWATYCMPCKKQFEYRDSLEKYLNSNHIEPMYISIDGDSQDTQWREMISFYKLKGYHIRANKSLTEDLRKLYNRDGLILVPWYLLIGENGNILNSHASPPSEIIRLKGKIKY